MSIYTKLSVYIVYYFPVILLNVIILIFSSVLTNKNIRIEIKFVKRMIFVGVKLKLLFHFIFSCLYVILLYFSMKNFFIGNILKINFSKTRRMLSCHCESAHSSPWFLWHLVLTKWHIAIANSVGLSVCRSRFCYFRHFQVG